MENLNWSGIILFIVIGLVVGGVTGYYISPKEVTGLSETEINNRISEAVEQALFQKDMQIETLEDLIVALENKTSDETTIKDEDKEPIQIGYLIDELSLGVPFVEDVFSDREINKFFDGEVEFDGKSYDAEETLIIKDIEFLANENDFDGNVYMTIPSGAVEYKLEFESNLNTSLIDLDDTLEFSFLGDTYEVISWDVDEIILTKGSEYVLSTGESVIVNNKTVFIKLISDDEVYLEVDEVGKAIDEGKTRTVNGLEISVKSASESTITSIAILKIAEEVETEIDDGDEYTEDSPWEWRISANSISLVLIEDFTEVDKDGDEEFPAIGVNEALCLPDSYVCVQFNGMIEEDTEEITLELDEKSGEEYVRIKGSFISGVEDYDKIYVNSTGIYDKDLELIDNDEIELENTDSFLERTSNWIVIEDFKVNYDLNDSEANGNGLNSKDEDWLSNFGIKILNPEDSVDDQEFSITIPSEKIEGSILIA